MTDLIDIVAPLPPPPAPWPIGWLVAGSVLLIGIVLGFWIWRWRRRRAQRRALRRLRRIERAVAGQTLDARQAAFGVAEALRLAYRTAHLTSAQQADSRWQALITQLDALRYRENAPATLPALLRDSRYWIRRAPC